jgi:bifunctional UDP-N-acetylglucosamine pyrophosphorylase/glucosamine-1-phosphate N-acetyltransferase
MQAASKEGPRRSLAVIILAAGLGTRMKSKTPKVLHQVCGKPMITWVFEAAAAVEPGRVLVVLGNGAEAVHQYLPQSAEVVIQEKQLGTGDAVRACEQALAGFEGNVLVMYGDTPLVTGGELEELLEEHEQGGSACTMMTVELEDPSYYGRVRRDGSGRVTGIVEHGDAGEEELLIREVNAGVYVFDAVPLWQALSQVDSDNSQGEAYLTDAIGVLTAHGERVGTLKVDDETVVLGVNSRLDLSRAVAIMRRRILERHMLAGVTIKDPSSTYIDAGVSIGRDTVIEPMTSLAGSTVVGEDCVIGPSTTLADTTIGDGCRVISSRLDGAEVADGGNIGPFTYLRPGTRLETGAKAGAFVEMKNSRIGEGSKVPHLSYIGDAEVGGGTNIGAGNITANYDGIDKHRTEIGSHVHTGANTVFVAPVSAGDGCMTGAGSVITGDIPAGALGISRADQRNVEGYAERKFGGKGSGKGKATKAEEETR